LTASKAIEPTRVMLIPMPSLSNRRQARRVGLRCALPGEVLVIAAEVAVGGSLLMIGRCSLTSSRNRARPRSKCSSINCRIRPRSIRSVPTSQPRR
jgi:hypothetical protein